MGSWMDPSLSLSMEAAYRCAQLQLKQLPADQLLAKADHFMLTALVNQRLLSQAMRRIAELELQQVSGHGESQLVSAPPAPPAPKPIPIKPRPWGLFGR